MAKPCPHPSWDRFYTSAFAGMQVRCTEPRGAKATSGTGVLGPHDYLWKCPLDHFAAEEALNKLVFS